MFHADDYKLLDLDQNPSEDHLQVRSDFIKKFLDISKDIHSKMQKAYDRNKKYYDKRRSELEFEIEML